MSILKLYITKKGEFFMKKIIDAFWEFAENPVNMLCVLIGSLALSYLFGMTLRIVESCLELIANRT